MIPRRLCGLVVAVVLTAGVACSGAGGAPQLASSVGAGVRVAPLGPLPSFTPIAPAIRLNASAGIDDALLHRIRRVPGVAGAARVALAQVVVRTPAGNAELTVAGVEPLEFRPFAPLSTARDARIWQGLLGGDLFIAHEEEPRLGLQLGKPALVIQGSEQDFVRIGGLAANGAPNLAGGIMSLRWAGRFGVASPRLVVVGVKQGADPEAVARAVRAGIPSVRFENEPASAAGVAFLSGGDAAALFGRFTFVPREDGRIEPDPRWVRANISTRTVPVLGSVTCHRLIFPQLVGALREIQRQGLASLMHAAEFHRAGGCYVPRFIMRDPMRPVSMHAWGLALDVNVAENPYGAAPAMDPRIVAAFERWGFRWGGRWSPPDGMHFELAALLRR